MTTRLIEIESFFLFLLAGFAGVTFAFYFNHPPKIQTSFRLPIVAIADPTPTVVPTPKVEVFSQVSPNGDRKVTMTVTPNKTTSKTYSFTVSNGDGSGPQTIYSINLPIDETMSIPFNSFSPDNKYLFLQHNTRSGGEAFVFQADGSPLSDNETYFNAAGIFAARNTGNTYQETTGWASETLLIINTTTPDGSKGPSYWLEIPSKAVIQLSTEF